MFFFLYGEGNKEKQPSDTKDTSRDSDKSSTQAPGTTNESKAADQPAPIPRSASVSKPVPKPRPRSVVIEQDTNPQPKVPETTERPVAPPRAKSKPSRGDSEAGAQKDRADKAPKPKPPHRPDLNAPPPVRPKPKPVHSEPPAEKRVSPPASDNLSNAVAMTNPFLNEDSLDSNVQDTQSSDENIEDNSDCGSSVGGTKKAGPPPIPRRVDLE